MNENLPIELQYTESKNPGGNRTVLEYNKMPKKKAIEIFLKLNQVYKNPNLNVQVSCRNDILKISVIKNDKTEEYIEDIEKLIKNIYDGKCS